MKFIHLFIHSFYYRYNIATEDYVLQIDELYPCVQCSYQLHVRALTNLLLFRVASDTQENLSASTPYNSLSHYRILRVYIYSQIQSSEHIYN